MWGLPNEHIFILPSYRISSHVLENEELQLGLEHAQAGNGIATPRRNESSFESHTHLLYKSTAVRIVAYEVFALLCLRVVLNQQQVPFFHQSQLAVCRSRVPRQDNMGAALSYPSVRPINVCFSENNAASVRPEYCAISPFRAVFLIIYLRLYLFDFLD